MSYSIGQMLWLFFIYSFAGWLTEVIVSSLNRKPYAGRGFLSAPFCYAYGIAAVTMTAAFGGLRESPFLLYLACTATGTLIQFLLVKILRIFGKDRWWDYTGRPVNIGGDLCLHYCLFFGVPGLIIVDWFNDFLISVYDSLPRVVPYAVIGYFCFLMAIDVIGALLPAERSQGGFGVLRRWHARLHAFTFRVGDQIASLFHKHVEKDAALQRKPGSEPEKLKYREVLWIFLIGSFLGCIIETIFCRFALGSWMSRSSLVFGQLSVVWGLSILLGTILLRKSQDRSVWYIFLIGTAGGIAFEYILSFMGEIAFGKKFWDYSGYTLNIGGRVNLAFSFLWGLSAVIWIKLFYPPIKKLIRLILKRTGLWLSAAALIILAIDLTVSYMALDRYKARTDGAIEATVIDGWLDRAFPDSVMSTRFPTAVDPWNTEIEKRKRGEL